MSTTCCEGVAVGRALRSIVLGGTLGALERRLGAGVLALRALWARPRVDTVTLSIVRIACVGQLGRRPAVACGVGEAVCRALATKPVLLARVAPCPLPMPEDIAIWTYASVGREVADTVRRPERVTVLIIATEVPCRSRSH